MTEKDNLGLTDELKQKENNASVEFHDLLAPLFSKAVELGIIEKDVVRFTQRFTEIARPYLTSPIQHHAAAVLAINDHLKYLNMEDIDDADRALMVLVVALIISDMYAQMLEKELKKGKALRTSTEI